MEGLPFAPTLTGGIVTGLHFRSNAPLVGSLAFPAAANTLNQLQHAIVWTQAANILGNPSDCPQRDERMGWTGDAGRWRTSRQKTNAHPKLSPTNTHPNFRP